MLIAFLSDLHGNREAVAACLADAERRGAGRLVFLGDSVGYGADPEWVLDTVRERVARGAIALLGNHDEGVWDQRSRMNPVAAAALAWTRGRLDAGAVAFLRSLPLSVEEDDRLYVHADASAPERWRYVLDAETAARSLNATQQRLTFCGHTHQPRLFGLTATEKLAAFRPVRDVAVPLTPPRRWLSVLGSVGQPRDDDPAACYGLFDVSRSEMCWVRVPYDAAAAAAKVLAAGLPPSLAQRLLEGR